MCKYEHIPQNSLFPFTPSDTLIKGQCDIRGVSLSASRHRSIIEARAVTQSIL